MHRVDPICDIYAELYYSPIANKLTLASYYHIMAQLFTSKTENLKELLYWMMNELLEESEPPEDAIRVINKIVASLPEAAHIYLIENVDEP